MICWQCDAGSGILAKVKASFGQTTITFQAGGVFPSGHGQTNLLTVYNVT